MSKHYRDAKTGEYVPPEYAAAHPDTTVAEHDKSPSPKGPPDLPGLPSTFDENGQIVVPYAWLQAIAEDPIRDALVGGAAGTFVSRLITAGQVIVYDAAHAPAYDYSVPGDELRAVSQDPATGGLGDGPLGLFLPWLMTRMGDALGDSSRPAPVLVIHPAAEDMGEAIDVDVLDGAAGFKDDDEARAAHERSGEQGGGSF